MKITIPMEYLDGKIRKYEINASMPFEMFGFTFAAHRRILPHHEDDGFDYEPYDWRVSEVTTGGAVVVCKKSRKEAIEAAKQRLIVRGKRETLRAIKSALTY